MKSWLRKALFLALPLALALAGGLGLQPQPVYSIQLCSMNGRPCFTPGQSFTCTYFGCCQTVWTGSCVCSGGTWHCTVPPTCPPDIC